MGRREARGDSNNAMNTSDRSELECLQDSAATGNDTGDESPRLDRCRPHSADKRHRNTIRDVAGLTPTAPEEVKKHQHKHNLKHRYEVMETLGKGTYGKVKRAVERASQKTVSVINMMQNVIFRPSIDIHTIVLKMPCRYLR